MPDNTSSGGNLFKVHAIGGLSCLLIIAGSVYFAGSSISKRRGLFFSARQELANTKGQLNEAIGQRTALAARVDVLERESSEQIELVSVKKLNARTAAIVEIAESTKLSIDSLQPRERITDKRVPVQPLEFSGNANAENVFAFLGLMRDRMPDIHIQSIDILSESTESSMVHIDMEMYWFIDPASVE